VHASSLHFAKVPSMKVTNDRALPTIAAHRFGLGEPDVHATVGDDARGWLLAQIGPADAALGDNLVSSTEGLRIFAAFTDERQRLRRVNPAGPAASMPGEAMSDEQVFAKHFREVSQGDIRSDLATAAATRRPFAERLVLFWANHFTVSMAKPTVRSLVGAFQREAIRPHIAGRFAVMLEAVVKHPSMLRYLDNDASTGPNAEMAVRRARQAARNSDATPRVLGLNENLAREVLELHTLGASAARGGLYTQADVTSLARVLTGWRIPRSAYDSSVSPAAGASSSLAPPDTGVAHHWATRFELAWHEPGTKTVLGKTYPEGSAGLDAVLADLARHPQTARFVCTKLARHLVADQPPPALIERMVAAWARSDGDLTSVVQALVEGYEAWDAVPTKLKSPEEYAISTARVLGLGAGFFTRQPDAGLSVMGQRVMAQPSPAGWPDTADDWLGPDAVWKRVEWTTRLAERAARQVDARALARSCLAARLTPHTLEQIDRAADGAQALALMLLSPEFQRR
jgi:uncharacterized protein (DUF1800 family)